MESHNGSKLFAEKAGRAGRPSHSSLAFFGSYEKQGRVRRVVKAQQLWYAIIESQTETGTPYMLYKDSCNRKSNQQNLGTIKCSNLCTEIVEYTSQEEVGWRGGAGAEASRAPSLLPRRKLGSPACRVLVNRRLLPCRLAERWKEPGRGQTRLHPARHEGLCCTGEGR